jgi:hypothetical protein
MASQQNIEKKAKLSDMSFIIFQTQDSDFVPAIVTVIRNLFLRDFASLILPHTYISNSSLRVNV